jgi:hypothetical protein
LRAGNEKLKEKKKEKKREKKGKKKGVPYSFDIPARPSARNIKKLNGFPSNLLRGDFY